MHRAVSDFMVGLIALSSEPHSMAPRCHLLPPSSALAANPMVTTGSTTAASFFPADRSEHP